MHITRRLGHRAYQRIRAEHLAEEARLASAPADDPTPPPKPTKESRERERAEKLRDRYDCLFELEYAAEVVPWLDTWVHLERTVGPQERHDFLEPFIRRAQHDPHRHAAEIVFLLIVFGPVRGSAVKALRNATFVERIEVSAPPAGSLPHRCCSCSTSAPTSLHCPTSQRCSQKPVAQASKPWSSFKT